MEEVIDRMCGCDFAYLPYWFHPAYAESVRLCFPTKLTTYLTAGCPMFYHGPENAAVVDFFDRFRIGRCCHTLSVPQIAEQLETMALDENGRLKMKSQIRLAVDEELNLQVFHRRFHELIFGEQLVSDVSKRGRGVQPSGRKVLTQ